MSDFIKGLDKAINIDKELVEVAPKTGIKQIRDLGKKLLTMQEKYSALNDAVINEMNKRFDEINSIESNKEIEKIQNEIFRLDNIVLCEKGKTSFEKMQLDMLTYNINGYYKKDLKTNNTYIYECVKKFREVGIGISSKDFCISEYAKEYMEVLIEEADKGNINSERVKDTFEKVYWKCSDILVHIYVNIMIIYDEHENEIDKYFDSKIQEVLSNLKVTQKEVENKKLELIRELDKLKGVDGRIILDSFLDNSYNINDYRTNNYNEKYTNLISKSPETLSDEEKAEMDVNVEKLHKNLVEYTSYLEYKFLSDEILRIKAEKVKEAQKEVQKDAKKDNKKNKKVMSAYEKMQNDVKKSVEDIRKMNSELGGTSEKKGFLWFKKETKKNDKAKILKRDNKILELKELYAKLENGKLREKINNNIDDTSKILDVLKMASYYYGFLARTIIKKYPEITEPEIDKMIEKYRKFIRFYEFSVINHVNINEKKDISVVIKDKYKLLGLTLTKENFSDANLEEFVKQTQIVNYYNHIAKSNINVEDIQFVMNSRSILNK